MRISWLPGLAVLFLAVMSLMAPEGRAGERQLLGGVVDIGKYSDRYEARFGVMSYDTGLFTSKLYDGAVINGEILFPSPDFLSAIGSPRPHIGFDFAAVDDPIHFLYAGLTWDTHLTERVYLTASVGGALTTADNLDNRNDGYKALGCNTLFHLGAGIGYDITKSTSIQLYADHFSNANLCSPNNGAEAAGIRFGYRF